ncbi:MAG TPA: CHAT domain-containing protein [Pyrinomonadaceae bacterium]
MKKFEELIHRLNQLVVNKDWPAAYEAARELWSYPAYEEELTDDQLRDTYVSVLFKIADLFRYQGADDATALTALKRAYSLDTGHSVTSAKASYKELGAHKLGLLYEAAKCHNSAVWWFRRSSDLARAANVKENILTNLGKLALNLEVVGSYEEAGQYYVEMLTMLSDERAVREHLHWLTPAAMFLIHHGDHARGEEIMRELVSVTLQETNPTAPPEEALPTWFLASLNALGMHYIATERYEAAIELARLIMEKTTRFENAKWVHDSMHGLIARALVHMGQLDSALKELVEVHDVEPATFVGYTSDSLIETFELWVDIARIHVANHRHEAGITAYEILAYQLGAFIADWHTAKTTRLRFYWLKQMAFVVHEMVSVWLSLTEPQIRQAIEARVANAVLQLKANLFTAMEVHKLAVLKYSTGSDLFIANRRYAVAARKASDKPDDIETMLELEDALFRREQIEKRILTGDFLPVPGLSRVLKYDFISWRELSDDTLLLDYSVVNYQPPDNGLPGPSRGLRYIGIRLTRGNLRMVDLGETQQIEELCQPLLQAVSRPPQTPAVDTDSGPQNIRHLRPLDSDQEKNALNLDQLMERVYEKVVAPFEPLKSSLLISPDGILAALPFQALVHEDRFLIEDRDIAFCHSLLQRETLSKRQMSPGARAVPSITRSALLLGDPNYTTSRLLSLPGTKMEVTRVAELLKTEKFKSGANVFEEVQIWTGAEATASRLIELKWPRVIHIAAHGHFDEDKIGLLRTRPVTFGGSYRRWEEMGASPMTELDNSLAHSMLVLSEDSEADGEHDKGVVLTALELASLNLIGCHVVVLSACETGLGVTEHGAGVLGFQYALQASFAKAGLLSLWKVPDRETASFMIDFYRNYLDRQSVKAGYLATVRDHCRRNEQRVHPYYWAAFVLLDQEYYHPVF